MPTTSADHGRPTDSHRPQASLHGYGNSELRSAPSSTRNRFGSTPSTPASELALATGLPVSSSDNSDSSPTDETTCWLSERGQRRARKPLSLGQQLSSHELLGRTTESGRSTTCVTVARISLAQPLEIALGDEAFDVALSDVELAVFGEGDGAVWC
jgi:hypothetical protein